MSAKSAQQEALEEFRRIAAEEGIDLARRSACYPPGCRIHAHADDEKRRWATFATRLNASAKRSTKPRRDEKER